MPLNYWSSLSESEVVATLDRITHGVAAIGPDWRFRYLNQPAATMLDRPRSALIGRTLWSYFHNTGTEHFRSALEACVRDRRASRSPSTTPRCSGGLSAAAFRKDENVVVLFRDTSDRQLADERLREYSDRKSEAERIAHFGVGRWDLRTGLSYVSDELNAIYGLEPLPARPNDELTAKCIRRPANGLPRSSRTPARRPAILLRAPDRAARRRRANPPLPRARGPRARRRGDRPDRGLPRPHRAVPDRAGARAQPAPDAGHPRSRALARLGQGPDDRYVMVNAKCGRLLDLPMEEIVGSRAHNLFPEPAEAQRARDARALAEDDPVYDESVLVVGGEPRTFDTVTFALPEEFGRAIETCTIGTDVTERRELESERRERVQWVTRIESALREDRMLVYAQPIVSIGGGDQVGAELLVRMRAAEDPSTILQPSAILPAAERCGLVQKIDAWMVRQALGLARSFAPSVNLSAVTLGGPAARQEILDILRSDPDRARSSRSPRSSGCGRSPRASRTRRPSRCSRSSASNYAQGYHLVRRRRCAQRRPGRFRA